MSVPLRVTEPENKKGIAFSAVGSLNASDDVMDSLSKTT